jgi:apolipoprotein N-acyltransferase
VIGIPAYGALRIAQVRADMEAAPKLKIAAIQGNFSIMEMRNRQSKLPILRREQVLTGQLQARGAELAVWGETAYPFGNQFWRDSTTDLPPGNPRKVQQGFTIPVVFGTVTRDRTGRDKYPYNTAIMLDGQGRVTGMYDKVYRLAFGEYAPLVDPDWYLKMIPNAAHIAQGKGPGVLTVETPTGTWRLGPFICYEDILPRFVREAANQDVHVLVNLTNDAWFGKTHEPAQHLGLAVFRTVEHRKGMVRAVNTGISTYIDPTGEAIEKTRVTDPDIDGPQGADGVLAEVPMMDPQARTLYGVTGELFNGLMLLGILVIGWKSRGVVVEPSGGAKVEAKPQAEGKPGNTDDVKAKVEEKPTADGAKPAEDEGAAATEA